MHAYGWETILFSRVGSIHSFPRIEDVVARSAKILSTTAAKLSIHIPVAVSDSNSTISIAFWKHHEAPKVLVPHSPSLNLSFKFFHGSNYAKMAKSIRSKCKRKARSEFRETIGNVRPEFYVNVLGWSTGYLILLFSHTQTLTCG